MVGDDTLEVQVMSEDTGLWLTKHRELPFFLKRRYFLGIIPYYTDIDIPVHECRMSAARIARTMDAKNVRILAVSHHRCDGNRVIWKNGEWTT